MQPNVYVHVPELVQCNGCYVNSIDEDGSLAELHHTEQSLEQTGLPSPRATYNPNLRKWGEEKNQNSHLM